jgi:hypothetical protein
LVIRCGQERPLAFLEFGRTTVADCNKFWDITHSDVGDLAIIVSPVHTLCRQQQAIECNMVVTHVLFERLDGFTWLRLGAHVNDLSKLLRVQTSGNLFDLRRTGTEWICNGSKLHHTEPFSAHVEFSAGSTHPLVQRAALREIP